MILIGTWFIEAERDMVLRYDLFGCIISLDELSMLEVGTAAQIFRGNELP